MIHYVEDAVNVHSLCEKLRGDIFLARVAILVRNRDCVDLEPVRR